MTDNDTKKIGNVDWHSGFYGAIGLEFIENDDDLTLIDEHRLNHQPIRIDLLVVKKNKKIQIANELGAAFLYFSYTDSSYEAAGSGIALLAVKS